jgi:hypothetical protein
MPTSNALARIAVIARFWIGRRHHTYSFVPHARFTPRTSAWKKRIAVHARMPNAIRPALCRERTTPSMMATIRWDSAASIGMYWLT